MTDFILSDLHVFHDKIRCKDFAKFIKKTWCEKITNSDTVYNLGDMFFGEDVCSMNILTLDLPFKKMYMVLGNHDTDRKIRKVFTQYENIHLCSSRKIELPQGDVLLTHVPVHPYVMNEESRDGRKKLLNIHGHIHRPSPELGNKYFNVNYDVEKTFYKLDDILQSKGITR